MGQDKTMMEHTSEVSITAMPIESFLREGESQKQRLIEEVMQNLFAALPDGKHAQPNFILSDGTKCFLKKFSAPYQNQDGETVYGFDVKFSGGPLSHLEFIVKCSGWERNFSPPT